jgi:peroxiredoxin
MNDKAGSMRDRCRIPNTLALALLIALAATVRADTPKAKPGLVLHLAGGGFVSGEPVDSDRPGVIRWHGTAFSEPFEFDIAEVVSIHASGTPSLSPPRAAGDYCLDLAAGDVLSGALVGLDDESLTLDVPRLGLLHVRRSSIQRLTRWRGGSEVVYVGPNGLSGWKDVSSAPDYGWIEDAGALASPKSGVALFSDIGLPARSAIELEISWPPTSKRPPDFVLALGVDDAAQSAREAFRVEVWDEDIVVTRETDDVADVAAISAEPGRLRLRLYLDQERERLVVFSAAGTPLADLQVSGAKPAVRPGVRLENKGGEFRLERLRVTRWDGKTPHETTAAASTLHRADGSTLPCLSARYDPASKSIVVRDGDGNETRVSEGELSSLVFPRPDAGKPRSVRLALHDGTRLSGDWLGVEKGKALLAVPGVTGSLRIPLADLRSLVPPREVHRPGDGALATPRLEAEGVHLGGDLIDGVERPGASCLVWKPSGSASAAALRSGVSGRVVYKEPPPLPPPPPRPNDRQAQILLLRQQQLQMVARQEQLRFEKEAPPPNANDRRAQIQLLQQQQLQLVARQEQLRFQAVEAQMPRKQQGAAGQLQVVIPELGGEASPPTAVNDKRASLHLRTGDVIPLEVTKIDENGLTFRSPISEKTFVAHDRIKAVELAASLPRTVRLSKSKRERLLMLPRMQKGSPPTHLVRSRNGDYLRGRVVAMDETKIQVETRLETKDIPRDRVSRIIWLHADELGPDEDAPPPDPAGPPAPAPAGKAEAEDATRVQAVRSDGTRITFTADRVADATLTGSSDLLGRCKVRFDEADQILFGSAIEKEAARLAYQQWKLQYAPEPKDAANDGGTSSGTESAMVGKPAPDFQLDLLDGKPFQLSESKGQVVVLDFWAAWCGPCLQSMPQVEKVVSGFKPRGARLVAVNLQDSPAEIKATLERHKLDLTVALDRNGAIAEKYGAHSIPQTVVIDRDGKVFRVYVGGGNHLGEQLQNALESLLPGEGAKGK